MREIIQDPNPLLGEKSEQLEGITDLVREVAGELLHYVEQPNCTGLAAVQLGVKLRMIAIDINGEPTIVINPVIMKASEQTYEAYEGCMSIDNGKTAFLVRRHKQVLVTGLSIVNLPMHVKGRGLFGASLQHEIDHLDGKLISDRR